MKLGKRDHIKVSVLAKYSFSKISMFDTQIKHYFILIFDEEINDHTFYFSALF